MVLIATLKDENYLGWDRTVRLNIKGIGRHLQTGDSCEVEGAFPAYHYLSMGYFEKLRFERIMYKG